MFQNYVRESPLTDTSMGRLSFRVGLAIGDVVFSQADRLGDGVALAVRIQEMAGPGEVAISDIAHQIILGKVSATFTDGGVRLLKNLPTPQRVWLWPGA
jgi:class 3 adenylate cyclase